LLLLSSPGVGVASVWADSTDNATTAPSATCNADPHVPYEETATIVGTSGNDNLVGTPNRDVIAGLGGNDKIVGLDGNDVICTGDGDDRIEGGQW